MKILVLSSPLVDLQFAQKQKAHLSKKHKITVDTNSEVPVNDTAEAYVVNLTALEKADLSWVIQIKDNFPRNFLIIHLYGGTEVEAKEVLFTTKCNLLFNHTTETSTTALTQDGAEFKCSISEQHSLIEKVLTSKYYQTTIESLYVELNEEEKFVLKHYPRYSQDGRVYGTFAVRKDKGFVTSTRGKSGGSDAFSFVKKVNHKTYSIIANYKATLNAPLLDKMFKLNPHLMYLIHGHELVGKMVHGEYEFAGTNGDNKFAEKVKSGEKILLTNHGFIVGFSTFAEFKEYVNEK